MVWVCWAEVLNVLMMNTLLNKNKETNQILEALPNILTLMTLVISRVYSGVLLKLVIRMTEGIDIDDIGH